MNNSKAHDLLGISINLLAALWLKKSLILIPTAIISAYVIGLISPSGPPDAIHFWGYAGLTQASLILAMVVRVIGYLLGYQLPTKEVIEFVFRLLLGLALFPLICVLFLNRSKL